MIDPRVCYPDDQSKMFLQSSFVFHKSDNLQHLPTSASFLGSRNASSDRKQTSHEQRIEYSDAVIQEADKPLYGSLVPYPDYTDKTCTKYFYIELNHTSEQTVGHSKNMSIFLV